MSYKRTLRLYDIKLCNCAGCNCDLHSPEQKQEIIDGKCVTDVSLPPVVAGRIFGRPYCEECLALRATPAGDDVAWQHNSNPWQENAVLALEG